MSQHHALLRSLRNFLGSQSSRGPAYWFITAAVAVLLPSPLAAPLLVARLRRPDKE